jgi:hypothetical protein
LPARPRRDRPARAGAAGPPSSGSPAPGSRRPAAARRSQAAGPHVGVVAVAVQPTTTRPGRRSDRGLARRHRPDARTPRAAASRRPNDRPTRRGDGAFRLQRRAKSRRSAAATAGFRCCPPVRSLDGGAAGLAAVRPGEPGERDVVGRRRASPPRRRRRRRTPDSHVRRAGAGPAAPNTRTPSRRRREPRGLHPVPLAALPSSTPP